MMRYEVSRYRCHQSRYIDMRLHREMRFSKLSLKVIAPNNEATFCRAARFACSLPRKNRVSHVIETALHAKVNACLRYIRISDDCWYRYTNFYIESRRRMLCIVMPYWTYFSDCPDYSAIVKACRKSTRLEFVLFARDISVCDFRYVYSHAVRTYGSDFYTPHRECSIRRRSAGALFNTLINCTHNNNRVSWCELCRITESPTIAASFTMFGSSECPVRVAIILVIQR